MLLYLAFAVERLGFRVAGLMTLRVGHTHSVLGLPGNLAACDVMSQVMFCPAT